MKTGQMTLEIFLHDSVVSWMDGPIICVFVAKTVQILSG